MKRMKIENNIVAKKVYQTPEIERIVLDNEISLALQSTENTPYNGPNEGNNSMTPEYLNQDPFRNNRA